jgi:hypothetical protein
MILHVLSKLTILLHPQRNLALIVLPSWPPNAAQEKTAPAQNMNTCSHSTSRQLRKARLRN